MRASQTASDIVHILIRLWKEDKNVRYELEFAKVQGCQELYLDLPDNSRPVEDWVAQAVEDVSDIQIFLPDLGDGETIEICEEPIFYETIGEFTIEGNQDYYGEYDEEYSFDVRQWSVAIDERGHV